MKKLGKIKLNQFSSDELDRRKLNSLKGGCDCNYTCPCSCPSIGQGPGFDLGTSIGLSSKSGGSSPNARY